MKPFLALVVLGLLAAVLHAVLDPRCPECGHTHRHPNNAHRD